MAAQPDSPAARAIRSFSFRMVALGILLGCAIPLSRGAMDPLQANFAHPPRSAYPWVYWWWLDSAASKEGITADLEAMKAKGISGALLFDAGEGGPEAPKGPRFLSPEWLQLYRHSLREAHRLGIELGVNLCSGWDAGGTWVQPEHAAKELVWSETTVEGPGPRKIALPTPKSTAGYYRDIAVLAFPAQNNLAPGTKPARVQHLEIKAGREYANARSSGELAETLSPELPGAADPAPRQSAVRILAEGSALAESLSWDAPVGQWVVLRFGYTLLGSRTKCTSPGAEGYEIDFFDPKAFDHHFANTARPLLEIGRATAVRSLRYFHVDSYEAGNPSWSSVFRAEFQARRGYDLLQWMPVLAGYPIGNTALSDRFLWDVRRTIADLFAANYYGRLREMSHQAGMKIHPESSGPFWHCIDALQCAGGNDIPMTEFWKRRDESKEWVWWLTDCASFCDLVKQAASAAHTYGRPICQAEAYTTMGPNWEEDPFSMKDVGDRAFCAGLTRQVLCFYVHQPRTNAFPGFQWEAAGTHFDHHVTWWNLSDGWLDYLARCQYLLRQGLFVADFCYYYGEDAPNYVPARSQMRPALPSGYDCDTIDTKALLERLEARGDRVSLPDGMSYRYLVLPPRKAPALSPAVVRKLKQLAEGGTTIIGFAPAHAPGLTDWPNADAEVKALATELWGQQPGAKGQRTVGKGRMIWGQTPAEVAAADRVAPDLEVLECDPPVMPARFDGVASALDWIHRRDGETEIYFLANISSSNVSARLAFRAGGSRPELWNPVSGAVRRFASPAVEGGRTILGLEFAPRQSWFVVFRPTRTGTDKLEPAGTTSNLDTLAELTGTWDLSFDPKWGGPAHVAFDQLEDWVQRPEPGIRFYSGTCIYRKNFDLPETSTQVGNRRVYLDLGRVRNLAAVRLNGRNLGVVWTAPWRVEATGVLQPAGNMLEIQVVNLWPNRLIGDAALPVSERRTVTNVKKFKTGMPLLSSGLLGPVRLVQH